MPLALAPKAISCLLEAMTSQTACSPLEKIVVDAQLLVVAADDVVWRPCARVVVETKQAVQEASERIASAISASEKRLATHKTEECGGAPSVADADRAACDAHLAARSKFAQLTFRNDTP